MRPSTMVISSLNLAKVQENLNLIGVFLEKLEKMARIPKKAFLADERNPAASESFLRRCIEAIFDIGRHILSKSFSSKSLEHKEVALELGDKGVISKNYAGTLVKMAGYRNRLVHYYKEISNEEIYEILQNDLGDLEKFLKEIEKFLKKYRQIA
jgi:uncharacterized protein YutE (UPF0331/DUF86 family)